MQPTPYHPSTDFSQDEANNVSGRAGVRTANIDTEFGNIELTVSQINANLKILQRDDGLLHDAIVGVSSLDQYVLNLLGGFIVRGVWVTATVYNANDIVSDGAFQYLCIVTHTSGATLAANAANWQAFGFSGAGDAAISAAAAAASATSASNSAIGASNSAAAAATSATNSSNSATGSSASATNSANSASAASTSASNAAASAASAAAANIFSTGNLSLKVPSTPTASRDAAPSAGFFHYNPDLKKFEGYNGSAWGSVGGGAAGGGQDVIFQENSRYMTTNYTLGLGGQAPCTISNATPAVVTQTNSFVGGEEVFFQSTGTLPTGLSTNTTYFVSTTGLSSSSFQVSATRGGTSIATSSAGAGTQTCGIAKSAQVTGPLTIATSIALVVPSGQRLVIL